MYLRRLPGGGQVNRATPHWDPPTSPRVTADPCHYVALSHPLPVTETASKFAQMVLNLSLDNGHLGFK